MIYVDYMIISVNYVDYHISSNCFNYLTWFMLIMIWMFTYTYTTYGTAEYKKGLGFGAHGLDQGLGFRV